VKAILRPAVRYMVGSAFFFSVMALCVKVAGKRLPSQEIVALRGLLTFAMSWALIRRAGLSPWGTRRRLLFLRGLFGFLALSCFYWAVCHLPMAEATVIQHTNPVFTALLAAAVLGERIQLPVIASALLSLAGIALVARPASLFGGVAAALDPVGVAIALAGAIFSALAYVAVRELSKSEAPEVIVFYFPLVTVPLSLPGFAGGLWPTAWEWLALCGVAVSTQIAQNCLTRGLTLEKAGSAMAIGYLQVVFAIGWGVALFDEVPGGTTVAGALLVVVGTLLVATTPPSRE
jgi:drug/metabolite transporter (DMT)-like permease